MGELARGKKWGHGGHVVEWQYDEEWHDEEVLDKASFAALASDLAVVAAVEGHG